jgi:hypothetical protein
MPCKVLGTFYIIIGTVSGYDIDLKNFCCREELVKQMLKLVGANLNSSSARYVEDQVLGTGNCSCTGIEGITVAVLRNANRFETIYRL